MSGASSQLAAFNYAVQPLGNLQIKNITAAYTVSASDNNFILNCSGTSSYSIAIPPASSFPSGFNFIVWNNTTSASMTVTIDPNGTETIDGITTLALKRGEGTQVISDGTNWQTGNKKTMRAYAENSLATATRPIASGDRAMAIGESSQATSTETTSYGAYATSTASFAIAIGRASATGTSAIAIGFEASAAPSNSTAIGLNSASGGPKAVTGSGAMALGGSYASGTDSFAAAVANNTSTYGAQGSRSIAIGRQAQATVISSISIGESSQSTGSGGYSIAIGYTSIASGAGAVAIGNQYALASTIASGQSSTSIGDGCNATQAYATSLGSGANSIIIGKYAYSSAGYFAASGDAQTGTFVLRAATTSATPVVATTNGAATSATNQVILPNNSAYAFTGTVVARRQAAGGTESAAWKVEGLIRREANAGTTTLVASTVTAISNVPSWTLALSADTTNGGLAVTATGAASTNIRWVATIQTSECTYA
jgi:hypothetical protein